MSRGDRIVAVVDVGSGATREFQVEARKRGRRVRQRRSGAFTILEELTGRRLDTATIVESVKFQTQRLVAVAEQFGEPEELKAVRRSMATKATGPVERRREKKAPQLGLRLEDTPPPQSKPGDPGHAMGEAIAGAEQRRAAEAAAEMAHAGFGEGTTVVLGAEKAAQP